MLANSIVKPLQALSILQIFISFLYSSEFARNTSFSRFFLSISIYCPPFLFNTCSLSFSHRRFSIHPRKSFRFYSLGIWLLHLVWREGFFCCCRHRHTHTGYIFVYDNMTQLFANVVYRLKTIDSVINLVFGFPLVVKLFEHYT